MHRHLDPHVILASAAFAADEATPVKGGEDTAIWKITAGEVQYALRVFPRGRERSCRHEVEAMRIAREGAPVPDVQREGIWEGYPFLLLSWCPGRVLSEVILENLDGSLGLAEAAGRALASVHAIHPPPGALGSPRRWMQAAGADEALIDRLSAAVENVAALLHLDYHALNLLTDGTEITAILDWANALPGDPRADLARAVALLELSPLDPQTDQAVIAALPRYSRAMVRGYESVSGPLVEMPLFYAWAGAYTERDLAPRLAGTPGWDTYRSSLLAWTNRWREHGGLPPLS